MKKTIIQGLYAFCLISVGQNALAAPKPKVDPSAVKRRNLGMQNLDALFASIEGKSTIQNPQMSRSQAQKNVESGKSENLESSAPQLRNRAESSSKKPSFETPLRKSATASAISNSITTTVDKKNDSDVLDSSKKEVVATPEKQEQDRKNEVLSKEVSSPNVQTQERKPSVHDLVTSQEKAAAQRKALEQGKALQQEPNIEEETSQVINPLEQELAQKPNLSIDNLKTSQTAASNKQTVTQNSNNVEAIVALSRWGSLKKWVLNHKTSTALTGTGLLILGSYYAFPAVRASFASLGIPTPAWFTMDATLGWDKFKGAFNTVRTTLSEAEFSLESAKNLGSYLKTSAENAGSFVTRQLYEGYDYGRKIFTGS